MTTSSAGQKRQQKALKRQKKKQQARIKHDAYIAEKNKDKPKLSAILFDYAAPLLDMMEVESREDIESGIALAIECWNIGTYPDDISREMEEGFIGWLLDDQVVPQGEEEEVAIFIAIMIEGRRTIFGKDPRYVMEHEVLWDDNDYRLRVFSSVVPPIVFDELADEGFEQHKARLLADYNSSGQAPEKADKIETAE